MNAVTELVLRRLDEILDRLGHLERRVDDVAEDTDQIDRTLRPFGDGSRIPPRRGRRP